MKKIIIIFILLNCLSLSAGALPEDVLIPFSFENKKLESLVEDLTKIKQANFIIPQKVEDQKKFKEQIVTYLPKKQEIDFDQAWNLMITFLELSGFSIFEKEKNLYQIVSSGTKENPEISKEPIPLYVNVSPFNLPQSEERIKYIYYLKNLKLDEGKNPFTQIFKDLRSPNAPEPIYLSRLNAFLIVDKANIISSIISIISSLDETGFREAIEVLPIHNIAAQDVANILNSIKSALGEPKPEQVGTPPINKSIRAGILGSLSIDPKIIPDKRNNALIIMGPESAINQIVEFIQTYIDKPGASGSSILHYYDLQYLDAKTFGPILQNIVSIAPPNGQAVQTMPAGPIKFFSSVIVKYEEPVQVYRSPETIETQEIDRSDKESLAEVKGLEGQIKIGGNRLIIAALNEEWPAIKDLIERLDKPQPQVILETVIAEIRKDYTATIASTVRNRTLMPRFSDGIEFLASHITPPFNVLGPTPTQLAQDLLAVIDSENATALTTVVEPGSVLISLNDQATPGIWGLIQILNQIIDVQVNDHPHLICLNNQKSSISRKLQQRARGDIVAGPNGSFIIPIENVTATLNLAMVPHISSGGDLKLEVAVRIEDFIGNTLNRTTRGLSTVATINSGQILAIGGLIRNEVQEGFSYTPILGYIPILGALFRRETQQTIRNNIVIFICPTIVMPKDYDTQMYTKSKLNQSYFDIETEILNERDPITRLFFHDQTAKENILDDYCAQSQNLYATQNCFSPELINGSYFFPQVKQFTGNRLLNSENLKVKLQDQTNNFLEKINLSKQNGLRGAPPT